MVTREQWYWEKEGEAQGPFDARELAIGAALDHLRSDNDTGALDSIMDTVVDVLEGYDIRVGRLMPPGTLS